MSDTLFQSNQTFDDGVVDNTAPTDEQVYADSFEAALSTDEESAIETNQPTSLIAGMTDDELKEVLSKAKRFDELDERLTKTHDTAFGRMGNLEQQLKQLQQDRSIAPTATTISPDAFKSLDEYFGDSEFSEKLAGVLSNIPLSNGQSANHGIDEQRYAADIQGLRNDFEEKLVTIVHPDWREIKVSQEFGDWYQSLDEKSQGIIASSYKSEDVTQALNSFKAWRDKKADVHLKRQKRLEAAMPLTSSGNSGRGSRDDDSYEAAFNIAAASKRNK